MPPRKRRQRGSILPLPSGSYRVTVYAGRDALTGKARQLRETAKTYDEAKKVLTRLQRQVDEDKQPKSNITVRQAVEQWLEVAVLEETTRERYDDLLRLYVLPTLGHLQAARLDAELLERFYARLQRCREMCTGRARGGHTCRPLSSTTRKIHYLIRGALDRAVRWQHLGVNKAAMATAPSPRHHEPDPPNAEEAARLLNAAQADPEWAASLAHHAHGSPQRRGIRAALAPRRLRARAADDPPQQRPAEDGLKVKTTKTGQARKIAVDPHTLGLLATHRELFESRCAELGSTLSLDAFVFSPAPDGSTPFLPRAISQRYRRLALRLELRSTRLHSLRHYSATELIAAGVDVRTVAGRLGHGSGGATTLKVYAGWANEADRRAADTMATIVPKPSRRQQSRADRTRRLPRASGSRSAPASRYSATDGGAAGCRELCRRRHSTSSSVPTQGGRIDRGHARKESRGLDHLTHEAPGRQVPRPFAATVCQNQSTQAPPGPGPCSDGGGGVSPSIGKAVAAVVNNDKVNRRQRIDELDDDSRLKRVVTRPVGVTIYVRPQHQPG